MNNSLQPENTTSKIVWEPDTYKSQFGKFNGFPVVAIRAEGPDYYRWELMSGFGYHLARDAAKKAAEECFDELEALRARVAKLEEAARWRRIEEEKPPRSEHSENRSIAVFVRWRHPDKGWQYGVNRFDFRFGEFESFPYEEWRPIGDEPKEVVKDESDCSHSNFAKET